MTTSSLPQSAAAILSEVESFFDALPEKRRRKRTRAEINAAYDTTPERENYGPEPEPTITIELDDDAQVQLPKLLSQLGQARGHAVARVIEAKIYDLLGLEVDEGK